MFFLDADGNIKISDFGLSNCIEPGKLLDSFCGSPLYAAPEILLAERYVGPPVDVWSMGVILYALLCGHLPWCGDTQAEISHNSVRGIYDEPAGLSRSVRELIRKMLNPSPKDRITIEDIRLHPWINEGFKEPPPSLLEVRQPVFEVREEILHQLVSLGYKNLEDCRKKVLENELSQITATYHLLLDRLVDEEMLEIKKKLQRQSQQQQQQSNQQPHNKISAPNKVVTIDSDAMERRLSSPTRAVAISKLTAIPEDRESRELSSSVGDSSNPIIVKPRVGEQRRGSVAVDARSVLTSSLPIPRPEDKPARRVHAGTAPPGVVNNYNENNQQQPPARWQHRRSSVACGSMEPVANKQPQLNVYHNQQNHHQQASQKQNSAHNRKFDDMHDDPSRKFSLDSRASTGQMAREQGGDPSQPKTPTKKLSPSSSALLSPRLVKGVFKSSTTTSKSPDETVNTVKKSLKQGDLFVKRTSPYIFQCIDEESGVKFQLEVCKIQQLDLTGVHLKRICGDIWKYKALCNVLVNDMNL